jgi:hypothetical protein
MALYVGIDDTDSFEQPGTGRIARAIASRLSQKVRIIGITRHQLLVHPEIPYTSHNSCAVLHIADGEEVETGQIFEQVKECLQELFVKGSDPGLALGNEDQIGPALVHFGREAKQTILSQDRARTLARNSGILLEGLGGTEDGVIGALAGIGLAASRNDGRFIQRGSLRQMQKRATISSLMASGVDVVTTLDGRIVTEGWVQFRKFPKPALVQGKSVLFVNPVNGGYEEIIRG